MVRIFLVPRYFVWVTLTLGCNSITWNHNKTISDRIYRGNRMICQTAPEERSETSVRFAVVIDLVSAADYVVGYVFFLHRIAFLAAGDGLLPVRLPAGRQHPVHPVNPV